MISLSEKKFESILFSAIARVCQQMLNKNTPKNALFLWKNVKIVLRWGRKSPFTSHIPTLSPNPLRIPDRFPVI